MERPYPQGQTGIDLDALRDKLRDMYGYAARFTDEIDGVTVTLTLEEAVDTFRDKVKPFPWHDAIQTFGAMAEKALSLEKDSPAVFDMSLVAGRDALAKFISDEPTG